MDLYVIQVCNDTLDSGVDLFGPFVDDDHALEWIESIDPNIEGKGRINKWVITSASNPVGPMLSSL